jgi:hypothetical protein
MDDISKLKKVIKNSEKMGAFQQKKKAENIKPHAYLGNKYIVSQRFLDLALYRHIKINGIDMLLHQDWNKLYEVAKRDVYVPTIKEFFYRAHLVSENEIRTRVNNHTMTITLEDIAKILDISMEEGEKYSTIWMTQVNASYSIWKYSLKQRSKT